MDVGKNTEQQIVIIYTLYFLKDNNRQFKTIYSITATAIFESAVP